MYDITDFMHQHPGSPETLMENAGADASEFFEDVGHSLDARGLMKSLNSLAPGCAAAAAGTGGGGSKCRGPSASGARGSGGGGGSGGAFMLSSTAQRIRKGRALARREAKAVHAEMWVPGGVPGGGWGVQEFVCEHCEEAFEPTDLDADGSAGRERRLRCAGHPNGELRVFYSPVRGEWGGFYSCCRQHVCFCIPPEALV